MWGEFAPGAHTGMVENMENLENVKTVRVCGEDGKTYPAHQGGNTIRDAQARELRSQGWTLKAIAAHLNCSITTAHRITTPTTTRPAAR